MAEYVGPTFAATHGRGDDREESVYDVFADQVASFHRRLVDKGVPVEVAVQLTYKMGSLLLSKEKEHVVQDNPCIDGPG